MYGDGNMGIHVVNVRALAEYTDVGGRVISCGLVKCGVESMRKGRMC